MNRNRRAFLKSAALVSGAAVFTKPFNSFAGIMSKSDELGRHLNTVEIQHTANIQGNAVLIKKDYSILLDGGNFAGSRAAEAAAMMNAIGFQAGAFGAAELAEGEEKAFTLLRLLNYPIVNCNYRFSNTGMAENVKPYHIVHSGRFKIGITAVGEKIRGIDGVEPYAALNDTAKVLKQFHGCDIVICLSTLPAKAKNKADWDNQTLAERSLHTDIIIGGTVRSNAVLILKNAAGEDVVLSPNEKETGRSNKLNYTFRGEMKINFSTGALSAAI